jgi:hypothetical protein
MKSKTITALIVFSALFISVSGQKGYRSGYIIRNNLDTIKGMIKLASNNQNSTNCHFIRENEQKPVDYSPADIRGYRIENSKFYISKDVIIDSVPKRVFLEYLVKGIADLYYYKESDREYYFIEKEGRIYALTNKEIIVNVMDTANFLKSRYHERTYLVNSEKYKGMLRYLFQDSPPTLQMIPNTPFYYKSLINITKDYHNNVCKSYKCIDYTIAVKSNFSIEPYAGIIFSRMSISTSRDYKYNLRPTFGFNLRIGSSKGFSMWSFLLGMSYSNDNFRGDYDLNLWDYPRTYAINTSYSILRIPFGVERYFTKNKIQPFAGLCIANVFLLNKSYDLTRINFLYGPLPATSEFRTWNLGASVETGLKCNLKNGSFLILRAEGEYLQPSANLGSILERQRLVSVMFKIGYGFKLGKSKSTT